MDFNGFFTDTFWPNVNNPTLVDDLIKDEIKMEYTYNDLDLPETVVRSLQIGSTAIKNTQNAGYRCK